MSKQLLSIRELEARNASEPIFGKGITVASGFDLGAKAPLDSRSVARTIADRDAHVTGNRAYDGMLVYVEETQKTYQLVGGRWEEFGFNDEQFQAGIVNSLDSDATDKALSAKQGKVLNGKITAVEGEIATLEGRVEANENGIAGLEAKDVELEGKISANEVKIAGLEAKDVELEGKISTNTQSIATLDTKVDEEIANVTAEVERVEGKVDAVDTKVDALAGKTTLDIATAKTEAIEASKQYTDGEIAKANNSVTELEGRVEVLEGEMDTVEGGLAQEISDRKAADQTLQGEIDAVEVRMTDAEAAIEAVEGEVERVEGKVDALETKTTQDIATALNSAKAYTDEREVVINQAITAGDEATLESAKEYADTVAGQSLESAKTYADEKVAGLKSEITSPEEGQALDVKFGNVVVSGDLEVKGSVKSIERTELHVEDTIIEVNSAGVDVTSSDVHLGLRANLGNGNFSEIVYCPDTQKWVVVDSHPSVLAKHGDNAVTKTIAYAEDMNTELTELQDNLEAVTGRVDSLETGLESAEGRLDTVEGEIANLKAVENVTEKIAAPGASMMLAKTPFNNKVELYVNGLLYVDGFAVAGNVITWQLPDFEIESDDVVIAKYVVK